ncbi:hypothetical protein [Chryseobacterium oryctis]|uniref:Uncharacterized protein n=1 Tax=Chryseobacterium oryctis TaxID=2952618 RepID=A0ABT3HNL8_9FLAO|nr:hypothetical protein [Chryseobacterium oryctis]MCW3161390.1 hypothetical protein [Chryseobacterium oryctis]
MKKIFLCSFSLLFIISVVFNLYIERRLNLIFSKIKTENIKNLEHSSNNNFYKNGIENIGKKLQEELIKINIDECGFNVKKDYFFFFQNKVVYISNGQRCLRLNISYDFFKSIFKIKGFQNWN